MSWTHALSLWTSSKSVYGNEQSHPAVLTALVGNQIMQYITVEDLSFYYDKELSSSTSTTVLIVESLSLWLVKMELPRQQQRPSLGILHSKIWQGNHLKGRNTHGKNLGPNLSSEWLVLMLAFQVQFMGISRVVRRFGFVVWTPMMREYQGQSRLSWYVGTP